MQGNRLLTFSSLFACVTLERFAYYGMRSLLVLYFLDSEPGLGLPDDQAYGYYGFLGSLIYLSAIPSGIISDLFISRRWAVIVGSVVSAVGLFLIPMAGVPSFLIGAVLMCFGSNFVRLNLWVLVGRHYSKWDESREDVPLLEVLAVLFFLIGIVFILLRKPFKKIVSGIG